jgi:hypothetical protein
LKQPKESFKKGKCVLYKLNIHRKYHQQRFFFNILDLLFQKATPMSDFVSIPPSFDDTESSMEFSKQNQKDSVWNEIEQEKEVLYLNIVLTKIERTILPTEETLPTKNTAPTKEKVKEKKKGKF